MKIDLDSIRVFLINPIIFIISIIFAILAYIKIFFILVLAMLLFNLIFYYTDYYYKNYCKFTRNMTIFAIIINIFILCVLQYFNY